MRRALWWCVVLSACTQSARFVPSDEAGAGAGDSGSGDDAEAGAPVVAGGAGAEGGEGGSSPGMSKAGSGGRTVVEAGRAGAGGMPGAGGTAAPLGGVGGESGGDNGPIETVGGYGLGRSCDEKPRDLCVTDCLSLDRYAPERDASGELRCPDHAPVLATDCEINCKDVYGVPAFKKDYCWMCEAGTNCVEFEELPQQDFQCRAVPPDCSDGSDRPYCGPDGKVYDNWCDAARTRISSSSDEACEVPEGYYSCGSSRSYCREGRDYCYERKSHDAYASRYYSCAESPCVAKGGCECFGFGEGGASGEGAGGVPGDFSLVETCREELGRVFLSEGW